MMRRDAVVDAEWGRNHAERSPTPPGGSSAAVVSLRRAGETGAVVMRCLFLLVAVVACLSRPVVAAEHGLLSAADRNIYQQAFAAAGRGQWRLVRRLVRGAGEKLPAKVLVWQRLTQPGNGASFAEIARFLAANPDWPRTTMLRRQAESAITAATPAEEVLAWFNRYPPLITLGRVAMGEALIETGADETAFELLRRAWIEGNFGRRQERGFLRRHRRLLSRADHIARLDRLLWDGRHRQARRMLPRVAEPYRLLAEARMRLRQYQGGVDAAIRRVPESMRRDAGFLYERMRWRRRKGRTKDALEILSNPPQDMVRPKLWWRERAKIARWLLVKGDLRDAYRVVSEHGLGGSGAAYAEAEWMSGWIALRFVHETKAAFGHFRRMYAAVTTPISRARAAYWAGRAAQAADKASWARAWYAEAARYSATFYGQLARRAQGKTGPAPIPAEPRPDGADIMAFNGNELTRVVVLLAELDRPHLLRPFIDRLADLGDTPGRKVLAGRLALAIGRLDLAVNVARRAYRQGIPFMIMGYPVIRTPDGIPGRAMLLAVARQESNFRPGAKSHAGAIGLMQLMPNTARAVARVVQTRYSPTRLAGDSDYNLRLGHAYLAMLLERYEGSHALAIAAYNAGPKSVNRWLRQIGDPREDDIDAIDWIELIPYPETRNYVQRVLENMQVYRRRLAAARPEPQDRKPDR